MNGQRYLAMLQQKLPMFMTIHRARTFQQDSAPCHKSRIVTRWFHERQIRLLEWPGNSPDLNPIENMWSIMKSRLRKYDTGTVAKLRSALKFLWGQEISPELCKKLAHSMPNRLMSVIKAKGNITKY